MLMTDEEYMREALSLAEKAFELGEVPVGAVRSGKEKLSEGE